jgi:hypothetical protein
MLILLSSISIPRMYNGIRTGRVVLNHKIANKHISTIPPTPGQNNIARPVPLASGGSGAEEEVLCATSARITVLRVPIRALRARSTIVDIFVLSLW